MSESHLILRQKIAKIEVGVDHSHLLALEIAAKSRGVSVEKLLEIILSNVLKKRSGDSVEE